MLELSLFGTFEAKRDGVSLCARWVRQSHRLLALLTLNRNRAVGTDWILSALQMPDVVLPQALGALYDVLGNEDRSRIHHRNRQVHFDTAGIQVDLFEFDRLVARGTLESLAQAVKIHRGGLLKDWEEEGWFCDERENSLADYLESINTLTQAAIEGGDHDLAASFLRRYVNAYPEMDSAWTRLIEVYGMAGSIAQIEETVLRYHTTLRSRAVSQNRNLAPSSRFLQASERALAGPADTLALGHIYSDKWAGSAANQPPATST